MPSATASSSSPAPWPSFTPLIAALSRGDVDRDRVDVGGDAPWPRATAPARRRRAGRCRCRCRRCWRSACRRCFQPVERGEAAGGGRVLAGAEGEAGVDLEVDRVRRAGRRNASACGRRSGRRGSARARPGSSSPSRSCRRDARSRARRPAARRREQHQFLRRSAARRNRRGSASRRARAGSGSSATMHRRLVGMREEVVGFGQRLGLGAGAVEGDPPAHFGRFLRQPLVERLGQRRRHRSRQPSGSNSGCLAGHPLASSRWPTGAASAGSRSGWRRSWRCEARIGGEIGRMVGEAIIVAADRRQAVGIDHRPADAAVAAFPVPAQRARACGRAW